MQMKLHIYLIIWILWHVAASVILVWRGLYGMMIWSWDIRLQFQHAKKNVNLKKAILEKKHRNILKLKSN